MATATEQRSNVFRWDTHKVHQPEGAVVECETFEIRHMKAGRTGARKTWSAAPELLRYLTSKDGLQNLDEQKLVGLPVLDTTALESETTLTLSTPHELNILELGGGSGFVSVGLAKAIHASHSSTPTPLSSYRTVKIMCTDMDKQTISNMRHNVCETKETKTVAVEKLEWGNDVGGEKFDKALERKFRGHASSSHELLECKSDPVQLLTHVIASDVHYGETTLDPLSSIIASIKHRNPHVQVILMLNERSPNSVAELVEQIKLKVLEKEEDGHNFTIHVRDVRPSRGASGIVESGLEMKLIEC